MENVKRFDTRAYISFSLLINAVILPISIIARHFPVFEKSEQAEHILTSIHATSGFFFTVLLILHIRLNWTALKKHMLHNKRLKIRYDVFAATALIILTMLFLATWHYIL